MRSLSDILYNFHWVVPGDAARAAQAWGGFLGPFLSRRGIKSIINLRGDNSDLSWWQYETRTARSLGIAHLDTMMDSRKLPTRKMLVRLIDSFDAAPRPFMLKCSGGQDRTSFAAALYITHQSGWSALEIARGQFARFPYLHFPKKHQRWLRHFLDFAAEEAKGRPLGVWVKNEYTPEALKTWLDGRGMGDFYAGIFVVPTRSRWQW